MWGYSFLGQAVLASRVSLKCVHLPHAFAQQDWLHKHSAVAQRPRCLGSAAGQQRRPCAACMSPQSAVCSQLVLRLGINQSSHRIAGMKKVACGMCRVAV